MQQAKCFFAISVLVIKMCNVKMPSYALVFKFVSDFLDHVRDDETGPSLTPTPSGSVPAPVPSGASAVAAAAASPSSSSSQSIESQHTQSKALRCLKLLCESAVLAPFLLQLMTAK